MILPSLEKLSHATIITGSREKNLVILKNFLLANTIAVQGNPDVFIFNEDQFLTEHVTEIVTMLSNKKVSSHRFCIISCDYMAADVQNRLLKTLEEAQEKTYIVLLTTTSNHFLPTVLSRCQVMRGEEHSGVSRLSVEDFVKKTVSQRFQFIESWTKNKKDEDNLSKNEVVYFIDHLEKWLWGTGNREDQLFTDIKKMKEYASIRGASHRIVLDFLAMICPKQ